MRDADVQRVQALYPQIYRACHRRHARAPGSAAGISERDASLLGHLDRKMALSPTALAKHMGVGRSTMSATLNALSTRGLVTLARSAEDHRRLDVRITAAGERAMAATSILDADDVRKLLAL